MSYFSRIAHLNGLVEHYRTQLDIVQYEPARKFNEKMLVKCREELENINAEMKNDSN